MQVTYCPHHGLSLKLRNLASAEENHYSERMDDLGFLCQILGKGYRGDCGQKLARRHRDLKSTEKLPGIEIE